MDENGLEPATGQLSSISQPDPMRLLELTANAAQFLNPALGHFAKMCVDVAREKRLEIEARLSARLSELSGLFAELDKRRKDEIADRELQFLSLSVLFDIAKSSGDAALITEAMQCFKEYVRGAPSLTRDFTDALKAAEASLVLFPPAEQGE